MALLTYLSLQVVLVYVVRGLYEGEIPVWVGALGSAALGIVLVVVVLWLLNRRYGLLPGDVGIRFDRWWHDLLLAVVLMLMVFAITMPLAGLFQHLHEVYDVPMKEQEAVSLMRKARSPWGTLVMAATALMVAPFWEEVVFRGFLQPFFRRYLGGAVSIVLTAVLFSLIHDAGSAFLRVPVMLFPLALALGYAYHRTQRLAASMMLHVMFNSLTVLWMLHERFAAG